MDLFENLYKSNKLLILIVNRYEEIPEFSDYLGIVNECELIKFGERNSILADLEFMQLQNNEKIRDVKLPEPPEDVRVTVDADPLVSMSNVIVRYQDKSDHENMPWRALAVCRTERSRKIHPDFFDYRRSSSGLFQQSPAFRNSARFR